MAGRRDRRGDRREEILLAALEVFAERGYTGASIASIAERVGLTQQGVLHYFPSKDRLLAEVLMLRDQRNLDVIMLPGNEGAVTLDTVAALVEYNAQRRGIVQSFTVLSAESVIEDHPAKDFFQERYGSARAWMAEVVRAEIGDELPGGVTPEQAAPLIFAVMDGLQLQWLLAPDEIDMPALFRAFVSLLKAGVAAS
ncbi:TetR/AcrR family transcriptional regulator [Microtetraspora sp. NBRC 16547]|uniref:TetR/AcrR family transcriptional regulator n=1 Tax=Microtetraspora sp. NBRC 16547 TaxID=3030993 RepID=UPI0024A4679E|nr:TetR/AcrR family transcriptional regulator [Microtetraspora sp. NBRC 16547]GLW96515.1 TetR family transcriptional regulator [Microtetraspora sp. NBRC 16547]